MCDIFNIPSSGISIASVEKALSQVDKADPKSLLSFVEQLESLIIIERKRGRVVTCSSLKTRDVFELFSFKNKHTDFGDFRDYEVPEIKLNPSEPSARLKPSAQDLLKSVSSVWPQCNESNVRVFVSLLIHFVVEQINSEIESNSNCEGCFSSDTLNVPSPAPASHLTPVTRKKIQSSLQSSTPVTLKAYTEALVSWQTKDELDRKLIVRGYIDYGISYAQKTPKSLETFFAIAETKAVEEISERSWAQLLCYMGWYL